MSINDIQVIYKNITLIQKSLISNENKANELRKSFEKLLKKELNLELNDNRVSLYDMINLYIKKKQKYDLEYVCHELRKDLNQWSHYTDKKLTNKELNKYYVRFKNIVYTITGVKYKDKLNSKSFSLDNLKLNSKQKEAVLSKNRITLVRAGPDTGKTYLIVGRILNKLKNRNEKKIFALSFTNKASTELQNRVDDEIFLTNLSKYRNNIDTATIHSFALQYIQEYFKENEKKFNFIIIDDDEYQDIKNDFMGDEEKIRLYLKSNHLWTFDNIINVFIKTIKTNKNFQNFLSKQLNEIIIDEAQDLDKPQYEILSLLYQNIKNLKLFFVGDQNQNIYAFKGGSFDNMIDFFKNEKDFKVIELEHSYRCSQNILSFVNKFYNSNLFNAFGRQGEDIVYKEFINKEEEANWIAKLIKDKITKKKEFKDISIIYSNTFYFKEILEALNAYEVPFKVFGGQWIINKNIKFIRLMLNLIFTNNKYALQNLQLIWIKTVLKGENIDEVLIPLEYVVQLSNKLGNKRKNYKKLKVLLEFVKNIQKRIKDILIEDILSELISLAKKENLFDDKAIEDFEDLKKIIEDDSTLNNFNKFRFLLSPLHKTLGKFFSRSDKIIESDWYNNDNKFITVTTIHSSKGLEWDSVIIPGMSQDSFPRYFKTKTMREKEYPNELKKFYVACTRAKNALYLTRAKINDWGYKKDESIFIKQYLNEGK